LSLGWNFIWWLENVMIKIMGAKGSKDNGRHKNENIIMTCLLFLPLKSFHNNNDGLDHNIKIKIIQINSPLAHFSLEC
jgi:hypothetical protein